MRIFNNSKVILFTLLMLMVSGAIHAQRFSNDWIKNDQQYFKIKVSKEGIYRLDYLTLTTAIVQNGGLTSNLEPKKIQVFHLGEEIPIYVEGAADGSFDINDYIEFYAKPLDGSLDTRMYEKGLDDQLHSFSSIYSDTGIYFVTYLMPSSSDSGKRYQTYSNNAFNTPKYQYFVEERRDFDDAQYHNGIPFALGATDMGLSEYNSGEGYRSAAFGASTVGKFRLTHFTTTNYEPSGFSPFMHVVFLGANNIRNANPDHQVEVSYGKSLTSLNTSFDTIFEGYQVIDKKFTLSASDIDTGLDIRIQPLLNPPYNLQNVKYSHATLTYPSRFDLNNTSTKSFVLEPEFFNARHISWANYKSGFNSPLVYSPDLMIRVEPQILPTRDCRFMTPQSQSYDTFYLTDENDIQIVSSIEFTPLKNFSSSVNQYNYHIVTHRSLANSALEYLTYRANSYTPTIVYMDELYNSFSYGYKHPLAIRNYFDYLLESSNTFAPKFLLLWGKGVEVQYLKFPTLAQQDLVPVFGTPGSDNMYTSGLRGSSALEPAVATGRVTILNDQQGRDYLQKVREYESAGNQFWRKQVMHLGGGADASQAARINNDLNTMKGYVENSQFAGDVISFSRSNGTLIDPNIRRNTIENINSGKNLITFIGHGSAAVFDLDVGQPNDYENVGKYPICYFNGCSTGNPFSGDAGLPTTSLSYGLQMIRMQRRGAVAFIAQTSLAEERTVVTQTSTFYDEAFNKNYGKTIGELLQFMLLRTSANNSLRRIHCRQLLLQGDPAIKLYAPNKPEYQVRRENISLVPDIVSALADSFILRIKVENLGSYVDSLKPVIRIRRTYPDTRTVREYFDTLPAIRYEHTLDFVIYSKDANTAGTNEFTVHVNPLRQIEEFGNNYDNNQVSKDFNIANNGVSLIFPERFAIVEKDTVELTFQPLDLFEQNQQFTVEVDTSRRFDPLTSSAFQRRDFNENSIAKWKLPLPDYGQDSVPYYWRAYLRLGGPDGARVERSFTHIKTHPPGWCQTDYVQIEQGDLKVLTRDSAKRRMEFSSLIKPIWIDMTYTNPSAKGVKEAGFGSQDLNFGVCKQGLVVMIWNKNTLERFLLPDMVPECYWGRVWTPHSPPDQPQGINYQAYYVFDLAQTNEQTRFIDFVSKLPLGTYVTAFSQNTMSPLSWTPAVKTAFNDLGCIKSDSFDNDATVYVFRGAKGATKGTADEAYSVYDPNDPASNYVALESEMRGAGSQGFITSELIGPVDSWGTVYHWFEKEATGDQAHIDIITRTSSGEDSIVFGNVTNYATNISGLDAEKYRFIYLKATLEDEVLNTAPQLKEWRVTYKKVPEGTIDPGTDFVFYKDTLDEGDSFKFELNFRNISDLDFKDSLPIDFKLYAMQTQILVDSGRVWIDKALLADSAHRFVYQKGTRGMRGTYQFEMVVNRNFEQAEQILTNNAAVVNFYVLKDNLNPLLDVTFDGRHIVNNEIVSPNPLILMVSKDENKLLWQTDTSTFSIMLKYPNSTNFTEIPINSDLVNFIPASDQNNVAKLEFRPKDLPDGTYTLRVQSQDGSDNLAGVNYYEINFRVINEQTVTNFYPYPNPFSTSMRFVFTLTGNEVPQDIRISIMTLSGKVVRQITKEELGNIQIGNNVSEFVWDGTDQFGDLLANGVYLYKVEVTDANGNAVKEASFDEADASNREKYFKHNIGKIYIMR